jgi:transcriptional regulator with XRE-family HTH domain
MTSGTMIREARTRAWLSQGELSERTHKDRAQIARWEKDVVRPSIETLRELLRACGYDLELSLKPYEPNPEEDVELQGLMQRSPQENFEAMLEARDR